MSPLNPRAALSTHDVTNQPPPFEDVNLFATDAVLREAVKREGGETHAAHLNSFGARAGSAEVIAWSFEANRNPPELKTFDRYGRRIDEVELPPRYHKLMEVGLRRRRRLARLDGAKGRPRRAHRDPLHDGADRTGRVLPDDDDLRGPARIAPSTRPRPRMGAAHHRRPLRRLLATRRQPSAVRPSAWR